MTITVTPPAVSGSPTEESTIAEAVAIGGDIVIPVGTSWTYLPPLTILPGTTITVSGGGNNRATLSPSQETDDPLDSGSSHAVTCWGDNINITGIIFDADGKAGHSVTCDGNGITLTDCEAEGFSLKGFRLGNNLTPGVDGAVVAWVRCSATSTDGFTGKGITGFQADTANRQAGSLELTDCSVGVLTGGASEIALKVADCDSVVVTRFTFDQTVPQLISLAEGLGKVVFVGFDWARGAGDWLLMAPDLSSLDRNQNPRSLIFHGLYPKP